MKNQKIVDLEELDRVTHYIITMMFPSIIQNSALNIIHIKESRLIPKAKSMVE